MAKKNGNQRPQQKRAAPAQAAAPAAAPVVQEEKKEEVITDTVTNPPKADDQQDQQAQQDAAAQVDDQVEEEEEVSSTTVIDGDDETVVRLKGLLAKLKDALLGRGKDPKDFVEAAKLASMVTKTVMTNPKNPVFETVFAFFEENRDGVCQPTEFLKGSTTLPRNEEQQVGYLHGLFLDLAQRRNVSVNSSLVVTILKRPEITEYIRRKKAALLQA